MSTALRTALQIAQALARVHLNQADALIVLPIVAVNVVSVVPELARAVREPVHPLVAEGAEAIVQEPVKAIVPPVALAHAKEQRQAPVTPAANSVSNIAEWLHVKTLAATIAIRYATLPVRRDATALVSATPIRLASVAMVHVREAAETHAQ